MKTDAVGTGGWRPALRSDLPAIELFLRVHEVEAAGLISRLLNGDKLELPLSPRSSVYIYVPQDAGEGAEPPEGAGSGCTADLPWRMEPRQLVRALLYCGANGLVYPLFADADSCDDSQLVRLVLSRHFDCASAVGPARDVQRFESLFRIKGLVEVHYRLMRKYAPIVKELINGFEPGRTGVQSLPGPDGCRFADSTGTQILVRRASIEDFDGLFPLQEAYEREEVLTPIHHFEAAASKAAFARSFQDELIMAAIREGSFAGKAATNARAFTCDQIGGVFVRPELRRRGIGRLLMLSLIDQLAAGSKGAVLFVKSRNSAARSLYSGLGFEEIEDYRADYYEP